MEERKPRGNKLQLLSQALSAAISSLNLAKQIVNEIEHRGSFETPGLVGKYDGMFMVTEAGKKYPVPDNYAAKTRLVYGDKLKMVEGPEGRRFKYVGRVPFVEAEAKLVLKDGHFVAVAKGGSYKLIQSAVRHHNGEEGDKLVILLPKDEKHAPFAALQKIVGKEPKMKEGAPKEKRPAKAEEVGPAVEKAVPEGEKEKTKPAAKAARKVTKKTPTRAKKPVTKARAAAKTSKAKSASGGRKAPAKKGEKKIEPPGEEELR